MLIWISDIKKCYDYLSRAGTQKIWINEKYLFRIKGDNLKFEDILRSYFDIYLEFFGMTFFMHLNPLRVWGMKNKNL